jgi:hypothetical protein
MKVVGQDRGDLQSDSKKGRLCKRMQDKFRTYTKGNTLANSCSLPETPQPSRWYGWLLFSVIVLLLFMAFYVGYQLGFDRGMQIGVKLMGQVKEFGVVV